MDLQSLIVAFLRAIEMLAYTARANDDAGIGACIAECIIGCLAAIVEYFNKWAYVYVGRCSKERMTTRWGGVDLFIVQCSTAFFFDALAQVSTAIATWKPERTYLRSSKTVAGKLLLLT
jgi:hypothetical protein